MKKFILGYVIGSILSAFATDYLVRQDIYFKLTDKMTKRGWAD